MPNKISVLLVDDHTLVRRGFRRILEDEPDIAVAGEASDGAEAVKLAEELQPRVIVMDCAMPGMNGGDLGPIIRSRWPELPVLLITGHAGTASLQRDLGWTDMLGKPFVAAELDAKLRGLIGQRLESSAATIGPTTA